MNDFREKGSTSIPIALGNGWPLPPLLKAFCTSFRGVQESKKGEPGFCLRSSVSFPAFYLKVTCWISLTSWDHNSPVYAVFKTIYGFFNSPWRWWVCRGSFCKKQSLSRDFPRTYWYPKKILSTIQLLSCTAHTGFVGKTPIFLWVATTFSFGVEKVHSHIVTSAISTWTLLMFWCKMTTYPAPKDTY